MKKGKKRKNLGAKRQNEFGAFLRQFRLEKRSSTNFFISWFRSSNRIKNIREKYNHHQKFEPRNISLIFRRYFRAAVKRLYLAEIAEWFRRLGAKVTLPGISLNYLKQFKLPTLTLPHMTLPKMPRVNMLFWKPLFKLPKVSLPKVDFAKFKSVKLPALSLKKVKSLKPPNLSLISIKSLSWPRISQLRPETFSFSRVSVLNELAVTLPELTWIRINAERLPGFLTKILDGKITGFKIPTFKIPDLPIIQQTSFYQRDSRVLGNVYLKAVALGLLIFGLSWFPIYENLQVPAYALQLNGQTIAYSSDKTAAENAVASLKEVQSQSMHRKVDIAGEVNFVEVKVKRNQLARPENLQALLGEKLPFVAVATGIKINGELAFVVSDDDTAERLLRQLQDSYIQEGMKVDSITFADAVELVDVPVSVAEVLPVEDAIRLVKEGRQKRTIHVVKEGESLWAIAQAYDMPVEDLQKANPSIKGEHVDIGQEINLVAVEPLINVQVAGEMTVKENMPYKVKVETDRNLWRGTEKIKTAGENGLREVTYKVVMENGNIVNKEELKENIIKPVKNKVVVRGSKIVVASRGGSGVIGWPISGRITSNYGTRWGRSHTGLDIGGVTGQPVGAAAAGQVVSAGYSGAYGKMITIKHDNGIVTRYAHLSQFKVSAGQKVERGDLIGLVGNTGRSTGSHLHFEVMVSGRFKNPLTYLK